MWVVAVYGVSGASRKQAEAFYDALRKHMTSLATDGTPFFLAGDFQAVPRPGLSDSVRLSIVTAGPTSPPVPATQDSDRPFQQFLTDTNLFDPIDMWYDPTHPGTPYSVVTHPTHQTTKQQTRTYRRIDNVLAPHRLGCTRLSILPDEGSNWISDHAPVILTLDLASMCNASLPSNCPHYTPPVAVLPPRTSTLEDPARRALETSLASLAPLPKGFPPEYTHFSRELLQAFGEVAPAPLPPPLPVVPPSLLAPVPADLRAPSLKPAMAPLVDRIALLPELASSLQRALGVTLRQPLLRPPTRPGPPQRTTTNPAFSTSPALRRLRTLARRLGKCIKAMHDLQAQQSSSVPLPPDRTRTIRRLLSCPLPDNDATALLCPPASAPPVAPRPPGTAPHPHAYLPTPLCPCFHSGHCSCPQARTQRVAPDALPQAPAHFIPSSSLSLPLTPDPRFRAWIAQAGLIRKQTNCLATKEAKRLYALHRKAWFHTFSREQHKNSKRFQAMALGRPFTQRPSALRDPTQNVIHSCPSGLADVHHAHYSAMGVPRPPTRLADLSKPWLHPDIYLKTSSAVRALGPAASLCRPLDMASLKTLIGSLNNSAGGIDGIQNDLIKSLLWPSPPFPEDDKQNASTSDAKADRRLLLLALRGRQLLLRLILSLVNTVLESGQVPESLLRGEIISIYKGSGDPTLLTSYRPITLLSALYKLVTALLNQRITSISERVGGILTDAQCGSRPGQSADTSATVLHHIFKHAERTKAPIHVLATDISKAFDSVPYQGFLDAFSALGFDDPSLALLQALQSNFTCVARTFAGQSEAFNVDTGCKQGCGLSPLRFNVFLDMFIRYINSLGLGYSIHIVLVVSC